MCLKSIPAVPTGLLSDNITFVDILGREMSLSYADFRYWPVSIPCYKFIRSIYSQLCSDITNRCSMQDYKLHSAACHSRQV